MAALVAAILHYGPVYGYRADGERARVFASIVAGSVAFAWIVARALAVTEEGAPGRALAWALRPRWGPTVLLPLAVTAATIGVVVLGTGGGVEPAVARGVASPDAPNIVVVVVDTLRADALGAYGGADAATPNMDRLAAEGTLFEQALATSSWTLPSVASLFTSQLPGDHGFVTFGGALPRELESLPSLLSRAGYACRAVVGNELMDPERGFARGFELYDSYGNDLEGELFVSELFDRAVLLCGPRRTYGPAKRPLLRFDPKRPGWLGTKMTHYPYDETINERVFRYALQPTEGPQFLYVHYMAPHSPYLDHPLEFLPGQPAFKQDQRDALYANYRGEVRYTDRMLGELFEGLERAGVLEGAIVVLTSDHGEEFQEHGQWLHGNGLYEETLRVPLIVRAPGALPGRRIARPVSLLDVAPTLLDLAGLQAPESFHGESLRPWLEGRARSTGATGATGATETGVLAELYAKNASVSGQCLGAMKGTLKVIRRYDAAGEPTGTEVYDLSVDPEERRPSPEVPAELADLVRTLDERARRAVELTADDPGALDMDALQALGYVEDGEAPER